MSVRSWLRSRSKTENQRESKDSAIELLVLEGADAGQSFTVDSDVTYLGRHLAQSEVRGGIVLRDATVSTRQALIRRQGSVHVIEHLPEASNPTLVNGSAIKIEALVPGSQIQIGHVLIEVRNYTGTGLAELTQLVLPTDSTHPPKLEPPDHDRLIVLESMTGGLGTVYPITSPRTRIGRAAECEVQLKSLEVSRQHAEIVLENGEFALYHRSATNLTRVNDQIVEGRVVLRSGDRINLSSSVEITVELVAAAGESDPIEATRAIQREQSSGRDSGDVDLMGAMEQKVALDRKIAEDFTVKGSFLDVDVVNSHGMKLDIDMPQNIIVSFEHFRSYVSDIVKEFQGHVLNSNGDELMCFFESPENAIRAGQAMLLRIDKFNAKKNMLAKPFRFRIGVHSGTSLVDLKRGIAYSAILDAAGHLQKCAETNGMVISDATLTALESETGREHSASFRLGGVMEREGFDYHMWVRNPEPR